MKIGIIANYLKTSSLALAQKAVEVLIYSGAELYAPKDDDKRLSGVTYLNEDKLFEIADLFVVIGGDGTIIHNAKKAAMVNKAVLGINAGRVGYLAGLEANELEKLSLLLKEDYIIEKRMLLKVSLRGDYYYCLNDAVISKGNISRMIDITANIEGENISYRADGLIAATPTGSTAYSLSAGGPVVDYRLESIMLTPICPQSLYSRPILISSENSVRVGALAPVGAEVYLTIDGENSYLIGEKDEIIISKARDNFVKLIKLNKGSFLTALSEKFNLLG